jgi:hypothetical protein
VQKAKSLKRACDAYQFATYTGGNKQIGILAHQLYPLRIIYRAALGKGAAL